MIVCSTCDHEPAADATVGGACAHCGERLISIDTKDELLGAVIDGRFLVVAPLGKGGMGVVYRAKQISIGREVALKVLDRRFENDVNAVKRFFREAKLASTLAHPNTVPIIDFGQNSDGRLYLVMELVRGKTLLDEISRFGSLPLARVVAIGTQLCDALEVAHGMSIVHRDLKLENAMLLDGGRDHVKILDFGLARSLADPTAQVTATGMIAGTPRYMAPEIAFQGAAPEPSQDMYALGVMLAELSLGRALWSAPTIEELFTRKLATEQSLVGLIDELKPLVRMLLDANPKARPSAASVRATLGELERAPRSTPLPPDVAMKQLALAQSAVGLEPTIAPSFDERSEATGGGHPAGSAGRAGGGAPRGIDALLNPSLMRIDELGLPAKPVRATTAPDALGLPSKPAATPPPIARDGALASTPAPAAAPADARFTAPEPPQQLKLVVEPQAPPLVARHVRPVPVETRPKPNRTWMIPIAVLAIIGIGVFLLYNHERSRDEAWRYRGGISIRVVTGGNDEVLVDGERAGKTPLTLQLQKANTPIWIEAEGHIPQQIVPDHNQTVELVMP